MPNQITIGSHVIACDCLLTGRVTMVWRIPPTSGLCPPSSVYYRVQFPPHSPFIGDWAVYRQGEIALFIEPPKLANLKVNIVNLMRPKFPRFQT